MKKYLRRWYQRLIAPLATRADIDNLYTQLACLIELRELAGGTLPLGPLRGWAMSPDALLLVLRDILGRTAPRVVEFGSGESTVAIAAAMRSAGTAGTLITIENNPEFARSTTAKLRALGLVDRVDFRVVPLREYGPRLGQPGFRSYDLTGLSCSFDVALVDGPTTPYFGAATRSVPLEWCLRRLKSGSSIYLDDAARPEERALARALELEFPDATLEYIHTEKGLFKIDRASRQASSESLASVDMRLAPAT